MVSNNLMQNVFAFALLFPSISQVVLGFGGFAHDLPAGLRRSAPASHQKRAGLVSSITCAADQYLSVLNPTGCVACSKRDINATACTALASTSCSYGSVNATGYCAAAKCKSPSYPSADGKSCVTVSCPTNATACDSAGQATNCSYGLVLNGACVAANCPSGPSFLLPNGTACIDCQKAFGSDTTSCNANKALSCASGSVNSTGACSTPVVCKPNVQFNNGTGCVDCTVAYGPKTLTCDKNSALTCSQGSTIDSKSGACVSLNCAIGQFLTSNGTACADCKAVYGSTTLTCDSTKALTCSGTNNVNATGGCSTPACTLGSYLDPKSSTCQPCATTYGPLTLACDATSALNCTVGAALNKTTGQCSQLVCDPSSFFNGTSCQTCKSKYGNDVVTCDALKALSCNTGIVNALTGLCTSVNCTGASYLPPNSTVCQPCPDAKASACSSNGTSTACTSGVLNSTLGICSEVNCLAGTYLPLNGTACVDCKKTYGNNTATCDATKALSCSSGTLNATGVCADLTCAPGTFASLNGTTCTPCALAYGPLTLTCDAKSALNCTRGVVDNKTGFCTELNCTTPGTFLNANGTACQDCKKLFGPATVSCNALTALNCTAPAVVNATGSCSETKCSSGTYLSASNTTCLPCPDGQSSCQVLLKPLSAGGTIRCIGSDLESCVSHVECPPGLPIGANGECVSGQLYGHYAQTHQINYNSDSDFNGVYSMGLLDGYSKLPKMNIVEQAPYYTFEGGIKPYGSLTITAGFTLHSGAATLAGFDGMGVFLHSAMAKGSCKEPFKGLTFDSSNPVGPCLDMILSDAGCWISNGAGSFVACPSDLT